MALRRLSVAGLAWTCSIQLLLTVCDATARASQENKASSSWRRLRRHTAAEPDATNFCMGGRLAPQFFVLGTMKAGTSFFADAFMRSPGVVNYKPAQGEPECHAKEPWVFNKEWSDNTSKLWLSHYPECAQTPRMVAVDFTPGYFGNRKAPFMLKQAYGNNKPLVFMIFLREPMKRALWHYRHFQQIGVQDGRVPNCPADKFPGRFRDAVRRQLAQDKLCDCECDNIFQHSMYVESFKRYFNNFQPDRFHVVPYSLSVKEEVVRYAWDLMKLPHVEGEQAEIELQPPEDKALPSLTDELPGRLKFKFKTYMFDRAGAEEVAKVIANSGCHLYGFSGQHSVVRVSNWLDREWNG